MNPTTGYPSHYVGTYPYTHAPSYALGNCFYRALPPWCSRQVIIQAHLRMYIVPIFSLRGPHLSNADWMPLSRTSGINSRASIRPRHFQVAWRANLVQTFPTCSSISCVSLSGREKYKRWHLPIRSSLHDIGKRRLAGAPRNPIHLAAMLIGRSWQKR
jgi:hypothetical protein